jgi:hypothetical protein
MRGARKPVLIALALLVPTLAAMAAARWPVFRQDTPLAAACSSCDARHQNHLRRVAARAAEARP